jgi:hypothetical protein
VAKRRPSAKLRPSGGPLTYIGIAWYHREDYLALKAMFRDGKKLPDTFDDWRKIVRESTEMLRGDNVEIVKAYIDPKTFPEWCRARGMKMNAKARMQYPAEYARAGPEPPA